MRRCKLKPPISSLSTNTEAHTKEIDDVHHNIVNTDKGSDELLTSARVFILS